jgi:flagellar hook-associated protein 1 FlgK
MSGLMSSLQTANSALRAFSTALGVDSTNVSNSATPGYMAQRATINPIGNGGSSGGIDSVTITSTGSARADATVQAASTQAGWSSTQVAQLTPLNANFDITGESGILAAFQQFSSAYANAAADPTNQPLRSIALQSADAVATAFQSAATSLGSVQAQANLNVKDTVTQINALANQIQQINAGASLPSSNDGAAETQMRNALDQLSSLVDITAQQNPNGTVNVLVGGQIPLVQGDQVFPLTVSTSSSGNQISAAGWNDATSVLGGQLGSLLQVTNSTIPAILGSSTQQGSLNTLAQSFADSVNSLFTSGQNADGTPGTALFTYDASNGGANVAGSLTVDPSVTADQLALGNATQSNGVANSLAQLAATTDPTQQINGLSPQDYFAQIASGIGQQLSTATSQASADQTNLTSAQAARQQQSGVSLDTEAINITADERAYEASAQLVSIINQLTEEEVQILQ